MPKEIILGSKSKITTSPEFQREYIQYHDLVDGQEMPETLLFDESKKIFLKKTGLDEKKKLLYLLAHNGSTKAYKLLQKYRKKPDKPLKVWAELCMQECAGHLGAELLNQEETFMVMSGAGGDGQRLRYYFIFTPAKSRNFSAIQKILIKKSTQLSDKKLDGKTEKMEFGKSYVLLSVLLSMDVSAEIYFQEIYKAVNDKQKILRYHYYCNNVQKPTPKDIQEYLKSLE